MDFVVEGFGKVELWKLGASNAEVSASQSMLCVFPTVSQISTGAMDEEDRTTYWPDRIGNVEGEYWQSSS